MKMRSAEVGRVLFTLLALGPIALGQDPAGFEKHLTEFTLDNGLKFLILERHKAPALTCYTYANVGAVDEARGATGLAHLLEHLAFKGTRTVGTSDYEAEARAMARMDEAFQAIRWEQRKGKEADEECLGHWFRKLKEAREEAQRVLVPDEFTSALTGAGGVDLNAETGADHTAYYVSLPSSRLELWMLLESERLRQPVLRGFYEEKDAVMEERRQRTESHPIGRLQEELLAIAYKAHPYGTPAIGHRSDLEALTRAQAQSFFEKYYVPGNLTIAVVGDVDPARAKELATRYFGRLPCRPPPDPVETQEPPQAGAKRVVIEDPAQPFLMVAYHRPSIHHPDHAVFEAIADMVGTGRTSRLYADLVKRQKIATYTSALPAFPGNKYPALFLLYAIPSEPSTTQECERAIDAQMERLQREPVDQAGLEKARTLARARLVRQLDSDRGLAGQLTFYEVVTGDWRNLFRHLEQIDRVTAEDVQRVAKTYLSAGNRSVGVIETTAKRN